MYDQNLPIKEKIQIIATKVYGAKNVEYTEEASKQIQLIEDNGLDKQPIIISKTQMSLSDNPELLGKPKDFTLHVREVFVSNGAGFIVALSGQLITMPGLPKEPNAMQIDIDDKGRIKGLF